MVFGKKDNKKEVKCCIKTKKYKKWIYKKCEGKSKNNSWSQFRLNYPSY